MSKVGIRQPKIIMLAARFIRRAAQKSTAHLAQPFRALSSEPLTIPTDKEQQAGRRKEELDAEAGGEVGFNRDPIVPSSDAGTKANPILVRCRGGKGAGQIDKGRFLNSCFHRRHGQLPHLFTR